jgi:pimeloyl-ACP methyl ester carboxylesterase
MKIYEFNHQLGKPVVNLAYANGFLPQTYRRALQPLFDHYHVVSALARPMWDDGAPETLTSWSQLGNDLLDAAEILTDRPIVGIGHSVGGVATLYAASKRPERFTHLVLIDPTLLPPRTLWAIRIARWLHQGHRFPLAQGALRRRSRWESVTSAYDYFKTKRLFARWPADVLRDYAESVTVAAEDGGVKLAFSPEWEARIYQTIDTSVWSLPASVPHPTLVIRGELTDTFTAESAAKFHRLNPRAQIATVKGAGHLVPQEKPDETGKLLANFLGIA